jgi:hypothetical protein
MQDVTAFSLILLPGLNSLKDQAYLNAGRHCLVHPFKQKTQRETETIRRPPPPPQNFTMATVTTDATYQATCTSLSSMS